MTDPITAREKLIAVLCEQFPGLWTASAAEPADAILAAFPQIAESPPSGNEAVEAARSILARPQHHIMPEERIAATYILSLAAPTLHITTPESAALHNALKATSPVVSGPINTLPTQSVHVAEPPAQDAVEEAREVLRSIGHYKIHGASGLGTWEVFDEEHVVKVAAALTARDAKTEARVLEGCAKKCDGLQAAALRRASNPKVTQNYSSHQEAVAAGARECAAAIRAGGKL